MSVNSTFAGFPITIDSMTMWTYGPDSGITLDMKLFCIVKTQSQDWKASIHTKQRQTYKGELPKDELTLSDHNI